jgi:hypothetical protein
MTSIQKNNRNSKMYQVRAIFKDGNGKERDYESKQTDDIHEAHSIYQYGMWGLGSDVVSVELVEYPKKGACVIIDSETSKNVSRGHRVRKSLRLIMRNREEAIEKEKKDKKLLEKKNIFEKRFDSIVQSIILSRPTGGRMT